MFSSEKNIEQITLLGEKIKRFIELKTEYLKLDTVEKLVRIFAAFITILIVFSLIFGAFFYISLAVASWLAPIIGKAWGYCVVAGFFIVLLILFHFFRKQWIEKPVLKFLSELFLKNQS